jgi:hypothetical protein
MATIVTRSGKGSPLTHAEVDANFTNLNTDKIQSGDTVASLDINGGTIDGTVIGGSTPAAISGTTGSFSGNLTVDTNTLFVDAANNRVGVGTSSPDALLHLSVGAAKLRLGTTAADGHLDITRNSSTGDIEYNAAQPTFGAHVWQTAGTERGRINASGNLLVGTTSAIGPRLQVSAVASQHGIFGQSQSFDWFPLLAHNTATSGDNSFVSFGTEASYTQRGSISYNRAGGLVAYNTTSDYRSKDIAGPIDDASSIVLNLKPYMGTMKGATVARPMFVAHETQEIAPYAVTGEKDAVDSDGNPKYQQMDHSALVPLLTAALREALVEIADLKARVAALEGATA